MSKKSATSVSESTALAAIGERFPVLNPTTAAEFAVILRENLGGEGVDQFDLERIRVPAGGGQFWELADDTGEISPLKSFDGVVVHWKPAKSYWSTPIGANAGSPPDCRSDDGVVGIGSPGGDCSRCPLNQFGSKPATADDPQPRGKACRDQRLLVVLREGSLMPSVVAVPPSGIAGLKKYFLSLASRGQSFSSVVTRFSLTPDKSATGVGYSLIQFAMGEALEPHAAASIRDYAAAIAPAVQSVRDDAA